MLPKDLLEDLEQGDRTMEMLKIEEPSYNALPTLLAGIANPTYWVGHQQQLQQASALWSPPTNHFFRTWAELL